MPGTVSEEEVIANKELIPKTKDKEEVEESKTESKSKSTKRAQLVSNDSTVDEGTLRLQKNIYVVFVECETSGNVGFLARTMANFGLKNLVLINPCELKDDAYYQAMHAKNLVENAIICDNLESFLKKYSIDFIIGSTGTPGGSYNLSRIPIPPNELGEKMDTNTNIAILFGREGDGLTNDEIDKCDIIVSIPTDPHYPIMNITHAAAIIFYEIFKNRNHFPVEGYDESTQIEKDYLLKDMKELIDTIKIPDHKKRNGLKTFKNIINRAFITGREAHTLIGILRRLKMRIDEK
ncbi:TrmJ/YjtD family RNA methyltransferase [Methanobrevibacter acididurans]|uniref:TrmJ/YjtD family RNA methyltransferase n=1 Tax=Methanobrevibacter acididurans TaxID=120963 RepID=UPI0038FCCF26